MNVKPYSQINYFSSTRSSSQPTIMTLSFPQPLTNFHQGLCELVWTPFLVISFGMLSIKPKNPNTITVRCFNNHLATSAQQYLFQLWILAELRMISSRNNLITRAIQFRLVEESVLYLSNAISYACEEWVKETRPACLPWAFASPGVSAAKIFWATTSSPRSAFLYILRGIICERTWIPLLEADFWIRALVPGQRNRCVLLFAWRGGCQLVWWQCPCLGPRR